MNTGWREIDIQGCYSLLKIAFTPNLQVQEQSRNMTLQSNRGDVTMLTQKRQSLAAMVKSAIDNVLSGIVCSEHKIVCKK